MPTAQNPVWCPTRYHEDMPVTPAAARRRLIDDRLIRLRATGATYAQIADAINREFGTNHVQKWVRDRVEKIMTETPNDGVETARAIEADRLDQMQARLWADLQRPTPQLVMETDPETGKRVRISISPGRESQIMRVRTASADTLLRLMERRAKLLGLDAPPASAQAVPVTVTFSPDVAPVGMTDAVVEVEAPPAGP